MTDYLWAKRSENYNRMDFYGVHDEDDELMLVEGAPVLGTTSGALRAEAQAYSRKKLEDFARSQAHVMLVSPKAREVIEAFAPGLPGVEWLPVELVSSSGKAVTKKSYHVLHLIDHVDALDPAASGASYSFICPGDIDDVEQLVIDPAKIPQDRPIFRLAHYTYPIFFSRALAEKIQEAGLSGVGFGEIGAFDSFALF